MIPHPRHNGSPEGALLASIDRWNLLLGGILIAAAALVRPRWSVVGGVALGAGLATANFHLIRRILERMLAAQSKGLMSFALLAKMAGMMAAVWLLLRFLPIDVIAFTVGLSIFLVSMFLAAIRLATFQAQQGAESESSAAASSGAQGT